MPATSRPLGICAALWLVALVDGDGWACEPDVGKNCQQRSGPASNQSYDDWAAQYHSWQAKGRSAFHFSAYDRPELRWARTSFVQTQTMLHDRFLYDRAARVWTVDRYLGDLTERYGGVDSVLLWQFYPNAGIDARNNFDFIDSLPGGLPAVKKLIADFHSHGVKVLFPYFPWDTGTHSTGKPQYIAQIAKMIEIGADGFNGDTVAGLNESFWQEAVRRGRPMVMEPEIMGLKSSKWSGTGLATNVMSWGYWDYRQAPTVDAFKTLDVRHLTHICERWAMERTDGLHHFWFNGIGCMS